MTASYSRTAGETVAAALHISATLSPAGVLGNYDITYNTAGFTIDTKAASVTPNAASKTYGDADPALDRHARGFLAADGVTASYSRTAGETVAAALHHQRDARARRLCWATTPSPTTRRPSRSRQGGVGDAERGEQDLRRGGPGASRARSSASWPADGVTATYSRTAGETVRRPYTISATLSPAGVLGNYDHHLQHRRLHDHDEGGVGDAERREQDLRRGGPGVHRHARGFLAADGVTATYSRTAGETVGALHHQRDAERRRVCSATTTITYNTANFDITTKAASVTPSGRGQDLRRGGPDADRHARRLPGGGRRDGELQPHGGRDGAAPTPSARRSRRRACSATTTSPTTPPASTSRRRPRR